MPDVSVIIPTYNHARFLAGAIRSVLRQTYRDFEIIVVDDGSTDDCRPVVAGFAPDVRYIWEQNQGLAAARNTGIRYARAELIGLLDADDEWLPDYLERMVALARQNPGVAAFYCGAQSMDVTGRDLPQKFGTPARAPEALYWTLVRANFIIPSTALLRRSLVQSAGLFDAKLRACEDWDLWLRLLPAHRVVGLSNCLVRYRVHANTLSTNADSMQAAARAVVEKNFGGDDGDERAWSEAKRRAWGGLYRYHALTCVQRNRDWPTAARHLARALRIDTTLEADVDLFYELALGAQPQGYRGTAIDLHVSENLAHVDAMLGPAPRRACATASFAAGLAAYHTGELALSFRCMLRALILRPALVRDRRLLSTLAKCPLGRSVLDRVRRTKSRSPQTAAVRQACS